MKKLLLICVLFLLGASEIFSQVEVSTRLSRALQNSKSTDFVRGFVVLNDQVDILELDRQLYAENATLQQRAYRVITTLQEKAQNTQENLKIFLETRMQERSVFSYESFWITNMFVIVAHPSVFEELMVSTEVSMLDLDVELQLDRPIYSEYSGNGTESVEPGIKIINAHKLWEMGITGLGRIVMGIDTGVDVTHPALNYKWRGNSVPANQAWFDPAGSTTPNDCDGHGTHTMGTMNGRSTTTADTVGIAINATWIAAKTICSSPHTSNSIAAFQWSMNPDGNPSTTNDMPDGIGNSWYDPNIGDECTSIYKATLDAVEAAGIAVVFSAGNSGPNATTITKPKNISTTEVNVWATAAIDGASYLGGNTNPIASFSSRGPSVCGGTGSLLIKPEASAPGVNVRSSVPGGGYDGTYSGTSMAAPHVVGAIALLREAYPTLTGHQVKMALYNTSKDLGTPGEDNTYGTGLIDVFAAYQSLGTPDTIPPTTISNLAAGDATSSSLKLTWTVPADTSPGGVVGYAIRMSNSPINDTTAFNNATVVPFTGTIDTAGATQQLMIPQLNAGTTYYFNVKSRDTWGNWSALSNSPMGVTLGAPVMVVTPDSIFHALGTNQTLVDSVLIANVSSNASTMNYNVELLNNTFPGTVEVSIVPLTKEGLAISNKIKPDVEVPAFGQSLEGQGGPDAFGYKWIDSDEPNGPQYVWNDISTTGTLATNWTATGTYDPKDEGYAGPFTLGFPFKFYGQVKNQIYVSSNGALLFAAPTANMFTNAAIPTAATPNDLICPFWDDLDGRTQGTVHYQQVGNNFVIQFTNWQKYSATGSLTFQVVLNSGGKIMFYYNNMNATLNSASVGIENGTGSIGLQVAYNANYVKNNHAVKFAAEPDWLGVTNLSGMLFNGNTAKVQLTFRSEDFPGGNYSMDLKVTSSDPVHPVKVVPIKMHIDFIPVELTSFTADVVGTDVRLSWSTATETNNEGFTIERRGENSAWTSIGSVRGNGTTTETMNYSFVEKNVANGKYAYRLKQRDFDGTTSFSKEIEVDVTLPKEYSLTQNYPNPFNPATTLSFSLPEKAVVSLNIYTTLGELVTSVINSEEREAGYYRINFDASKLTSGTYIYQIKANGSSKSFIDSKKMILVK